ncbi:MAG: aminotransferase class I/II-fold pyridoxal phosphate-dependent enzyme, partial [Clostridia bacterium]|nr:aminotransferase class I/II-fold pyridoxal phosphate-dependent enzyme [Clostridia bacterium]
MSQFLRKELQSLAPYVPGEQPKDGKPLIKLNTNESPFPPSKKVLAALSEAECAKLNLYSDPTELSLKQAIADFYGVETENVVCSNGSDEVLAFAFYAFCNQKDGVQFASVTYGFYPVFANLYGLPAKVHEDNANFEIEIEPYLKEKGTAVLANPNAQTGHFLPLCEIEKDFDFKDPPFGVTLPRVIYSSEMDECRRLLDVAAAKGAKFGLVSNIGHVDVVREAGLSLFGNIGMNVFNSSAISV